MDLLTKVVTVEAALDDRTAAANKSGETQLVHQSGILVTSEEHDYEGKRSA